MATVYNISVYNNDTFSGVNFTVRVNLVALNLTGAAIRMQVRKNRNEAAIIDLALGTGLTITDAAAGKFRIDEQIFSGVPGTYQYDIEIILGDGDVKTYIKGNFIIIGDITHV
jgi:hypothetical protein